MTTPSILHLLRGPHSLTRNLFVRMAAVICLGIILIVGVAGTQVSHRIDKRFDQQLTSGAQMLSNLMSEEIRAIGKAQTDPAVASKVPLLSDEDRKAFDDYADWRMFRIWYDGQVKLKSTSGPQQTSLPRATATGFENVGSGRHSWRIYTRVMPGGNPVIQVGERLDVRHALARKIVTELAMPFIVIAALMLLVVWFGIRKSLTDLETFSLFLARQKERPPFASIAAANWPVELTQLIGVINGLFQRIENSVLLERKFIDMAAHQLRTPLSGLSIEAQLCARTKDPQALEERLSKLNQSTRRVSDLLDQLLILAQLDSMAAGEKSPVSVIDVLSGVIADLAPMAARRGIEMAVEGDDFAVWGQRTAMELLLSNLLENAVKYAPDHSEVLIGLSVDPLNLRGRIEISDHGSGMDAAEKQQAFGRFWQADKGKNTGSGLGLAIAREASDALNGHLSLHDLSDGRHGLRVCFEAPLAR